MPTPVVEREDQLVEAVKAGREDKVRSLLECGCRVDAVDGEGRTALHWACQYGQLAILCLLLSHAATAGTLAATTSPDDGTNHQRGCPACGGDVTGSSLSEEDRDTHSDVSGFAPPSPLPSDERSGEPGSPAGGVAHVSSLTREKTHVAAPWQSRARKAGHCAACGSKLGRSSGRGVLTTAHVINTRDAKGHTPLHVACNFRQADVASFLVTLPSVDIEAVDKAGNTPLHRAIHADLDTLACLLCDAGANVHAANAERRTPLHEAVRNGSHDVIRTLVRRGCDVNAMTSSAAAATPFLTAIFHYRITSRRSEQSAQSLDTTLRVLIEAGCRLSLGDYQWTPLSAAVDVDRSFIASLLLLNGCLVGSACGERIPHARSLLVEAFSHCETHVVRLLVLCGYQPTPEEVDQCSRRIPSFSPLFYRISASERAAMRAKTHLLHWLGQRARCASSLMELSRTAVRVALNRAAGDASIIQRVPLLPLPAALTRYVGLADFVETLL